MTPQDWYDEQDLMTAEELDAAYEKASMREERVREGNWTAATTRKQTDLREFYTNPVAFGLKLAGVR